jgi:CRP-like cAMP-binding protein
MIEPADLDLLQQLPLFAGFDPQELADSAARFEERRFGKGDVVCRRGAPGDEFFVVASGELEVWNEDEVPGVIQRLRRGDFLGEISLLMGGTRSATVTASRPARLLSLSREVFEQQLLGNSHALEALSRVLCQRLASNARRHTPTRPCTLVGVCGLPGVRGKTLVATALARLLHELSPRPVLQVEVVAEASGTLAPPTASDLIGRVQSQPDGPATLALRVARRGRDAVIAETVIDLADRLADDFGLVVIDLGRRTRAAREACDAVVCLVADGEQPVDK